ncbi:hypothetical protein [Chondromyces crocatus]|nr:hypothetical protein [Chondromyces crocatus]
MGVALVVSTEVDPYAPKALGTVMYLVYLLPLLGALLADRVSSPRVISVAGMVVAMVGAGMLLLHAPWALVTGLLLCTGGMASTVPLLAVQLGGLYRQGDRRRDSGFTWFMVVGGAATAAGDAFFPGIWSTKGQGILAALVLLGAVVSAVRRQHELPAEGYVAGDVEAPRARLTRRDALRVGASVLAIGTLAGGAAWLVLSARTASMLVEHEGLVLGAGAVVVLLVAGWLLRRRPEERPLDAVAWQRLGVLGLLWGASLLCALWSQIEPWWLPSLPVTLQASELLFSGWFEVGSIVVSVLLAWGWLRLDGAGRRRSGAAKLAVGVLLSAVGAVVFLSIEGHGPEVAEQLAVVSSVLGKGGKLLVVPIGWAMVTKLAPARHAGVCMALWMAGPRLLAKSGMHVPEAWASLLQPGWGFPAWTVVAMLLWGAGLLLALPTLKRWMRGAEKPVVVRGEVGAGVGYRSDGRLEIGRARAQASSGALALVGPVAGVETPERAESARERDAREPGEAERERERVRVRRKKRKKAGSAEAEEREARTEVESDEETVVGDVDADAKEEEEEQRLYDAEMARRRKIYGGLLWALGGFVATLVTTIRTKEGPPIIIAYGAILYGVVTFVRGLLTPSPRWPRAE